MSYRMFCGLAVVALVVLAGVPAQAQLAPYEQDFEAMDWTSPTALGDDGWWVFGNVWGPDWAYWYWYGSFPAPNQTLGFSSLIAGEGGPDQGQQQLVTYSDYLNGNHWDNSGAFIEANFFQEQVIGAADLGTTWRFEFDVKHGDLAGGTTASAFFKLVDITPCCTVSVFPIDLTAMPGTWTHKSMDLYIDPSQEGVLLQFGFANMASSAEFSGMLYDNVRFAPAPLAVDFNVRPESCPNPINAAVQGLLPTAVMGTMDFDVQNIDPTSLRLEGVEPFLVGYEDVAAPYSGATCGCSDTSPDGVTDMTLKFLVQDLVAAIGTTAPGSYALTLTGTLLDGTEIEGIDCVFYVGGGASHRTFAIEGKTTKHRGPATPGVGLQRR